MLLFHAVAVVAALSSPAAAAPADPGHILAGAKSAFGYAHSQITTDFQCGWTRGTYMLGLWNYYAISHDAAAREYLQAWGKNYNFSLCNETHHHHHKPPPPPPPLAAGEEGEGQQLLLRHRGPRRLQGACRQDVGLGCQGVHNANNQLCGATYIELYKAGLDSPAPHSASTLASTEAVFAAEMASPSSSNFWSWLDAAFMSMNTWSRLAAVTGDAKYYEKQWTNFNAAMLLPANGDGVDKGTTFGFWNTSQHLFYRDDRYVHTEIYWGRGNGWAMGALVAAIQNGTHDPHRDEYVSIFRLHATKLASIMTVDPKGRGGYWHSSLLNATGYPTPEVGHVTLCPPTTHPSPDNCCPLLVGAG
eukprot:COSAG01_NODE_6425_length_3674_cov_4.169790_5_plen_360_part_00